jgi:hypothetical protein
MRPVTQGGVALVVRLRLQQPASGQHPAAALVLKETAGFAFKMKVGALTNTAQASLGGSTTADLQHVSQVPYQNQHDGRNFSGQTELSRPDDAGVG